MQVLRGDDQYMVKFENNLLKNLQIERLVYEENIYLHGQDRVLVPSPQHLRGIPAKHKSHCGN